MKIEAIEIAIQLTKGETSNSSHPYTWLMVFDCKDLSDFLAEVRSKFEDLPKAGEAIDALIYEWKESALVVASGALDEMFSPIRSRV